MKTEHSTTTNSSMAETETLVSSPPIQSPQPAIPSDSLPQLISRLEEDLIFLQILPSLPPKTLIRFQLVSKKWKTLISSTQFVKWTLNCTNTNPFASLRYCFFVKSPHSLKLLDCDRYDDVGVNVDDSDVDGLIDLDDLGTENGYKFVRLIGSCNGLLCVSMYRAGGTYSGKRSRLYVYNPITRLHFVVSNPVKSITACGFGYLESSNDYVIVLVSEGKGLFCMFSLNSSEWRDLKCRCRGLSGGGAFVNEKLHWLVDRGEGTGTREKCVLVVDLGDESCEELMLIPKLNENSRLCVMGSRLCIWTADFVSGEMWMLRKYGEWGTWTKLLSLDMVAGFESPCLNCFGITESRKALVQCGDRLVLVDPHQKPSRHVSLVKGVVDDSAVIFVESLVSPFPAT